MTFDDLKPIFQSRSTRSMQEATKQISYRMQFAQAATRHIAAVPQRSVENTLSM